MLKKGGSVTLNLRDKKIRLLLYKCSVILESLGFNGFELSLNLFDSKPYPPPSILECSRVRFISKFAYKQPYLKTSPVKS